MNREPLVTAIIIFLNGEKYLEEAIQSVVAQTYHNWELLLVDDGSTDNSTAIALSYAKNFEGKIKYMEHEGHQNKGMSATRNMGIKNSTGEYIGFLDADDVWLPEKLSDQLALFEQYPECGMVYGKTEIWHSWTGKEEDNGKDHFYPLGVTPNSTVYPPKIALLLLENKAQSPTTCNALLHKRVFEKAGFFVEDFKGMFEDAAFFFKVALFFPTYVSNAIWAKYRQHEESCSVISSTASQDDKARYIFLKWAKNYINQHNIFSVKLRITLFKELLPCKNSLLCKLLIAPIKRTRDFFKR